MGARWFTWAWVALLSGCPLPEDAFVLSGTVPYFGAGKEVRLLRNETASELRCDAFTPLATALTDDTGRYQFNLIRQQVTRGVAGRRFFRVEVDTGLAVTSQSFWFPDADFDLGELTFISPPAASLLTEVEIDGRIAWRADLTAPLRTSDRPFRWRTATSLRDWRTVPIDSVGRYDIVPVELRVEGRWNSATASATPTPQSRGAECPTVDVTPCPLTDGRFVPYVFPENTRELIFNFHHEVSVSPMLFHGLVLSRPAARARFDFSFQTDFTSWDRLSSVMMDLRLQELSVDRCNEPGVFLTTSPGGFIRPVALRVVFEDEAGQAVPIISLAEVTTP